MTKSTENPLLCLINPTQVYHGKFVHTILLLLFLGGRAQLDAATRQLHAWADAQIAAGGWVY